MAPIEPRRSDTSDRSPLAVKVQEYLDHKRVERGAAPSTLQDYGSTLFTMAREYPDSPIVAFEGDSGRRLVRTFWRTRWGSAQPSTRRKVVVHLRDFFRWLEEEGELERSPGRGLRSPGRPEHRVTDLFSDAERDRVYSAASRPRDQIALRFMLELGLRRTSLRLFKLGDYHPDRATAGFHWKGQRIHTLPITASLRRQLDEHLDERRHEARVGGRDVRLEYLLYSEGVRPDPRTPGGSVRWERRLRPMGDGTIYRWWCSRLAEAHVPHRRMHDARHSAIAEFIRRGGRLEHAQVLAGHRSIATTVDIYGHVGVADLAFALETSLEPVVPRGGA